MGYEEVSKAYRVYDIEVDQVVISRDVTFDESTFGFSLTLSQITMDDTALDFDSMSISNESCIMQFKQTGKRKSRSNSQQQVFQRTLPARHGTGLEEASAPDDWGRTKQNDDQALDPIWMKSEKAVTKMMMMPHLKSFGEQVPTQSKVLTCPNRQRSKMLLMGRIKRIGVRRFVPNWTR